MRVLGVDPGLARTGVAVVDGGTAALRLLHIARLETGPDSTDGLRLHELQRLLGETIAAWRPDVCAVERLFFNGNRSTAMRVSEARGVILAVCAGSGAAIAEYTPTQVKEAVTGYGAARKPQVMRMCRALLGEASLDGGDDAADACAVAICHHHRARLGGREATSQASMPAISPGLAAAVRAARVGVSGRPP